MQAFFLGLALKKVAIVPMATFAKFVGVRGFEPPASRPPDVHSNRAELHPELWCGCGCGCVVCRGLFVFVFVCEGDLINNFCIEQVAFLIRTCNHHTMFDRKHGPFYPGQLVCGVY